MAETVVLTVSALAVAAPDAVVVAVAFAVSVAAVGSGPFLALVVCVVFVVGLSVRGRMGVVVRVGAYVLLAVLNVVFIQVCSRQPVPAMSHTKQNALSSSSLHPCNLPALRQHP